MAPIPKTLPQRTVDDLPIVTPPSVLPHAALGSHIAAAASAVAARTQAPIELVVQHLLTLAAVAAQRRITVRLPTGAHRPVSCYFATVVEADAPCAAVGRLVGAHARPWYVPPAKGAPPVVFRFETNISSDENDEPNEVDAPFFRVEKVRQSTGEDGGPPFLFANHPFEVVPPGAKRIAEAARLCRLWDGEGAAEAGAFSLHLVATPRAGRAFLGDAGLMECGLLGRMLTSYPPSQIGARAWTLADDDAPPPAFAALQLRLNECHARTENRVIGFSEPAKHAYMAFTHELETAQAPGGAFAAIRPLAGHLAEHAARLAVLIALTENPELEKLSDTHFARGAAFARFYASEALRLLDVRDVSDDRLLELQMWLRRRATEDVTLRDICHAGPRSVRNVDDAFKVMRRLEKIGFVRPSAAGEDTVRRTRQPYRWYVSAETATDVA